MDESLTECTNKTMIPAQSAIKNRWQERLLPFMVRMVLALTVFFFIASCAQLIYLHWSISNVPELDIKESIASLLPQSDLKYEEIITMTKLRALIELEAHSSQRLYHQANILLMARIWTRYLGFVTGMILAMIGASFILGKLEVSPAEISAKVKITEFVLKSASPGIILCFLGVTLMLMTIITHHKIETVDVAVYLKDSQVVTSLDSQKSDVQERPTLIRPDKVTSQTEESKE